jgi:hypothetical protein
VNGHRTVTCDIQNSSGCERTKKLGTLYARNKAYPVLSVEGLTPPDSSQLSFSSYSLTFGSWVSAYFRASSSIRFSISWRVIIVSSLALVKEKSRAEGKSPRPRAAPTSGTSHRVRKRSHSLSRSFLTVKKKLQVPTRAQPLQWHVDKQTSQ